MNRKLALAVAITFALLSSMIVAAFASPPPIVQPMRFVQETIQGASPLTVDYSIAYDTASDEIIMNMMDTLVVFDGEHTDRYLPSVATSWTAEALGPGGTGIDSGLPIAGLVFENPDNQTGANATYYYRYTFAIRQGVFFQPPYNYSLTPEDVAFSARARAQIYRNIQLLAISDCPSFTVDQPVGRFFERDWVVDWYYNPVYGGSVSADTEEGLDIRVYNLWKWYYQAEAQLDPPANPPATTSALAGFNLPVDVNYDGKVDMRDIGLVAKAFGTSYGPPISARWVFRADINNDRKIDMKDIGLVAKQFGRTSHVWPTLLSNMTTTAGGNGPNIEITVPAGTTVTFTEHLYPVNATYTLVSVDWQESAWPSPLLEVQSGLSLTWTETYSISGLTYYVYNDIVFTLHTINGDYTTSICETAKVTVT